LRHLAHRSTNGLVFLARNSRPAAGLANAVMDAWTNFAKTGDPSSDTLGAWPAYVENRATMMIGEQTYVREAPYEEERVA
jgi:para-nitrobenzyl esterase